MAQISRYCNQLPENSTIFDRSGKRSGNLLLIMVQCQRIIAAIIKLEIDIIFFWEVNNYVT